VVYVSRDGLRLHYVEAGDPSGPAVLLHNGGCGDGAMWERGGWVAGLAGYRLLLLDHRGRGLSDRPYDRAAHRLEEYVSDVTAVLDDAGVGRAALLGYSDGGRVAAAVAATEPARVAALVVLDSVGPPEEDEGERATLAAAVRARGTRAVLEEMAATEPEPPPAWLLENVAATETEIFALALEAWSTSRSVWSDLPAITAPTLLLGGGLGDTRSAADLELAGALLADGTVSVLSDLAHLQMIWRTDAVLPLVERFLDTTVRGLSR